MVGKISEFDINKDDWRLYIERLEQYFLVNEVKVELYVPTVITFMGAESYELLVNLCIPEKPKNKTFAQLVAVMEKHLQPKPSELAERYKFRKRIQQNGEGIAEYIAVLKKMSKSCGFGAWLHESLRDQLACGISSESIRQRLFAETNLDFQKAYSLAVSLESAERDAASVVQGQARSYGDTACTVDCQAIEGSNSKWHRRGAGEPSEKETRGKNGPVREEGSLSARCGRQSQHGRDSETSGLKLHNRSARGSPASAAQPVAHRQQCRACGGSHAELTCRFARYVCRVCNRTGHLRRMCPNLASQCWVEASTNNSLSRESDESDKVINGSESVRLSQMAEEEGVEESSDLEKGDVSQPLVQGGSTKDESTTLCSPPSVEPLQKRQRKPVIRYGFEFD